MARELNYYQQEKEKAKNEVYGPTLESGTGSPAWNKFLSTVEGYGLTRDNFSDWDWHEAQADPEWGAALAAIKRDWNSATSDEQRALLNAKANQHRNLKGYSADQSGQGYYQSVESATPKQETGSGFQYQNETLYQKALNDLMNRKEFAWSKEEDPQWASLKKTYLREGERATADALGKASTATGGKPSTAAVTAATQAGDYYATQLNDLIPTLYQNAYNKYLQEYQQKLNSLGALGDDRAQKYKEWQLQTEWEREDAASAKAQAQEQVKAILEAGGTPDDTLLEVSGYGSLYKDALADYAARQRAQEDETRARETADWYAGYGDLSKVGEAGVNTAYQQAVLDAQLAQIRKQLAGGSVQTVPTKEQQEEEQTVDLSKWDLANLFNFLRAQGATQEEINEVAREVIRQGAFNGRTGKERTAGSLSEY